MEIINHSKQTQLVNHCSQQCLVLETRKPCYRKGDRAMRRIYGCPGQFRKSLATPMATIPEIVNVALL